jgi:hypothetical protein
MFANSPPSPPTDDTQWPTLPNWRKHESVLGTTSAEAVGRVILGEASSFRKLNKDSLNHVMCHWSLRLRDSIGWKVWKHEIIWCEFMAKAIF